MACDESFVAYVCEQAAGCGAVRARKMFGDYMVYLDDKPALLLCDNTVFVKQLPSLTPLLEKAETGVPYDGAKPHYVLDMDDPALVAQVCAVLIRELPLPKPRKKKASPVSGDNKK